MGKLIRYYLTENIREMLSDPVRTKGDILNVLLELSPFLLVEDKPVDKGIGEFVIKVEKMSRVFISLNESGVGAKHYSFNFPFIVIEDDFTNGKTFKMVSLRSKIEVDAKLLTVLKSLSAVGWFSDDGELSSTSMLDHYVALEDILKDLLESTDNVDNYINDAWQIIKELILMEPGYLRYDCDPIHQNGRLHPLHHIDVNYTNQVTFKLGLESQYPQDNFIDLLDLRTNCHYVS